LPKEMPLAAKATTSGKAAASKATTSSKTAAAAAPPKKKPAKASGKPKLAAPFSLSFLDEVELAEPTGDPEHDLLMSREMLLAQQLALERKQVERLKADFNYNLDLLRERDAELEKYDCETASLRAELERRAAATSAAVAEAKATGRRVEAERKRAVGLQSELDDAERKTRESSSASEQHAAEMARVRSEAEAALAQRSEALVEATKAQAVLATKSHELATTRNELQLRLDQQSRQHAEAEERWQSSLADERSQAAARAHEARAEAARAASSLQEQVEKLQAELAESSRST
jgi:hypothetical protein